MSTTTKTTTGAGLSTHEEEESMHFDTTLSFSRKAVQLHYQTGKKATENPTPGIPWTRWTIKTITPPTSNKKTSGFHCSLINQIGFAPTKQDQPPTNNPGESPPRTNLETIQIQITMGSFPTERKILNPVPT